MTSEDNKRKQIHISNFDQVFCKYDFASNYVNTYANLEMYAPTCFVGPIYQLIETTPS